EFMNTARVPPLIKVWLTQSDMCCCPEKPLLPLKVAAVPLIRKGSSAPVAIFAFVIPLAATLTVGTELLPPMAMDPSPAPMPLTVPGNDCPFAKLMRPLLLIARPPTATCDPLSVSNELIKVWLLLILGMWLGAALLRKIIWYSTGPSGCWAVGETLCQSSCWSGRRLAICVLGGC